MQRWLVGTFMGLAGMIAVLVTMDAPGLTIDEPINVGHGKRMVYVLSHPNDQTTVAERIEGLWGHAHEHPPLSRFLVGVAHHLFDSHPDDSSSFIPILGRFASAIAYGEILLLVTVWIWRLGGAFAGIAAGLATFALPRLFGHAHFASPEVISAAAILTGLMAGGLALDRLSRPWTWRTWIALVWAGFWVGVALLTKLTAILVPIALTIAFLIRYRLRGLLALLVIGLVSLTVLVIGWPWLWPIDLPGYSPAWMGTAERLAEFFRTGVERATIYVGYFGTQYPNETSGVPWHFVWVYFLVTVPIGIHALALVGAKPLWQIGRDVPSARLLLLQIVIVLGFFSLPIARYDGERLFLMLFPLWSMVAGIGSSSLVDLLSRWIPRLAALIMIAIILTAQFVGLVVYHPYQLSYYNLLIGGLAGAHRVGLEATYWGDTVSDSILNELAAKGSKGDRAVLMPSLYAGHAAYMTNRALAEKEIVIDPLSEQAVNEDQWAIVFNRGGYLGDPLPQQVMKEGTIAADVSRDGVWLTRLYRLPEKKLKSTTPAVQADSNER